METSASFSPCATLTVTELPSGENLAALLIRLINTCCNPLLSPKINTGLCSVRKTSAICVCLQWPSPPSETLPAQGSDPLASDQGSSCRFPNVRRSTGDLSGSSDGSTRFVMCASTHSVPPAYHPAGSILSLTWRRSAGCAIRGRRD